MRKQAKRIQKPQLIHWRLQVVVAFVCLLFVSLVGRAAYIQVIEPEKLRHESDMRTLRTTSNQVQRGLITDRNGEMLAVSVPVRAVYADPKVVHDKDGFNDMRRWRALADVLHEPLDELLARVQSNPRKRFTYLKRQVTPAVAHYIEQLKLPGIYLKSESRRYYPAGEISAQLVGITNIDDVGIEGIENTYNSWLTGTPSKQKVRKSRDGRVVERLDIIQEGESPNDLVLSIDQRIQQLAYRELKRATEMNQATSGSVVVLDVHTGEVLAMVNTPSYNPNSRENLQSHRMRNRALTDTFEPGSTVKPFVVVAALEAGIVKNDELIPTSPGWMRIGGRQVRDVRNYGDMSLAKILIKSSNVGISKLALEMPVQQLLGTYQSMGLGNYSGINLTGESAGLVQDRHRWSDFERATLSFGYGLTATPLQLARMYATLGSGGILYPVSILKLKQPPEGTRVIAPDVARDVINMLVGVTEKGGTGTRAHIEGYPVAGKSGTSRKAIAGGYGDDYVALFAGVAPANNPRLAMVVVINEPKGDRYYGGVVAAPVFGKVMSGALQMLNVEPVSDDARVQLAQVPRRAE
ncbi:MULTISPECIES: penicillin-binding transpeptidase domain-containing protein [Shewanella]|jgi:cell division protein FtsI (penicillin-binding protein 3)|uniref:Peptidoglycan D,D-transpeptidase FtsI n=1 Tax=Shewanella indica TaxID=768528 RepID=A0ABU4QB05_9GAMM|nr:MULTISPECIES: penicillin-binding transpeptidase domain-containing protein [Shewanella]OIN15916.1 peptidoglycan glycosyltransferase FtsI [Shewanella algae]BCV38328.1 peptidoglycan glycosyltransferase FtsI [Shewanella chilikensis]MCE9790692.1 peptidoglycan glycosyltransferase FtsI [Shewanella indica]MDX6015725.1 penicillin-binding transpeptidase domain-containing protein [Shewanella indica]NDO75817.1 peptidoglycan glycosyltransferase FtsI [Shewanella sp. SE1]